MTTPPPDDGQWRRRTVITFVVCALLNVALLACTFPIYIVEPGGPQAGVYSTTWLWVFAFPPSVVLSLGLEPLAIPLLVANPIIYGLIWTRAWQMYRLFRQPRPEE